MSEITARELHDRLLNITKVFHEFCEENDIRYYIVGGTALGAKRHKGFIPWDDDVDVAVPRPDYDRLIALQDKLPSGYSFSYYKKQTNSPMHYLKMIDENTTLIERFYDYIVEGLYIDIFPLDGALKCGLPEKIRQERIFKLFRRICWHCNTEEKVGLTRKLYKAFCSLGNLEKMHSRLERLLRKVGYEEGDYIVNFMGAYMEKEIVPAEIFKDRVLYDFEDTKLYGPGKIDEYLTRMYGNYMKLPPSNERDFHHGYAFLDLNNPYKEYQKS